MSNHDCNSIEQDSSRFSLSQDLLNESGLNPERIHVHQNRIVQALNHTVNTTIPVMGACTTSNGGILSWKLVTRVLSSTYHPHLRKFQKSSMRYWRENHLVSCIPAAGAASRFFSELHRFVIKIEEQAPELKTAYTAFKNKKQQLSLNLETRKNIQKVLSTTKVTPDFSALYENILNQDITDIKTPCKGFSESLIELLNTGTVDFPAELATTQKTFSKMTGLTSSRSENVIRTPWEYALTTGKEKNKKAEGSLYGQDTQKNELLQTHWMTRISPHLSDSWDDEPMVSKENLHLSIQEQNVIKAYAACCLLIEHYAHLPKAFVPTTLEGDSFLFLKLVEQIALLPSLGNVLVVPAHMQEKFSSAIEEMTVSLQETVNDIFSLRNSPFAPRWISESRKPTGDWIILEQGSALSTIRFCMDGAPFVDENGKYTPVSAGHGEIIHLFDHVSEKFPAAECLHIRNIDNVVGSSVDRYEELNIPAEAFRMLRDCLECLRAGVENLLAGNTRQISTLNNETDYKALGYLAQFIDQTIAKEALKACLDQTRPGTIAISCEALHKILGNLFHWQPQTEFPVDSQRERWLQTLEWLHRPLSVFGVVRKETGDVGGGPVFAKLPDGTTIKLCMEMPHASEEDIREYFGPRGRATHFNPVLAFFETRTGKYRHDEKQRSFGKKVEFSKLFDERFWLLSKREYKGQPVCYHETVLYELIGNSATTNLVFVEVPRTLFKPHKSYFDSVGNDRRTYGFDETLSTAETRNF